MVFAVLGGHTKKQARGSNLSGFLLYFRPQLPPPFHSFLLLFCVQFAALFLHLLVSLADNSERIGCGVGHLCEGVEVLGRTIRNRTHACIEHCRAGNCGL